MTVTASRPRPVAGPVRRQDGRPAARLAHQPALDGLRGLAVLAVVLYHAGTGWARGGFVGVDVFFVLSGYLITGLLVAEHHRTGRISLGGFYARRARRLLPALLLLLAVVGLYSGLLVPAQSRGALRTDAVATLLYVANWHTIAAGGSYFARAALPSPLQHTWSLAIEEQFYLVWPLVVLAAVRTRRPLQVLSRVALGGAALSALLMVVLYRGGDPTRVYEGTDTRAQGLLLGAALALALARRRPAAPAGGPRRHPPAALGLLAAAGGAALLAWVPLVGGSSSLPYRGGATLVALATVAVLVGVTLAPSGATARVLSWAPLRRLGVLSYGVYLWHWPLFLVLDAGRTHLHGTVLLGLRLAATWAAAEVSLHLVELPVRRGALPGWRAAVALPATAGVAVLAVLAGTAGATSPLAEGPVAADGAGTAVSPPVPTGPAVTPPAAPGPASHRAPAVPQRRRSATGPVRVMVVGDSVGLTLGQGLPATAAGVTVNVSSEAVLGCGIVRGGPFTYFGSTSAALPQCQDWPAVWAADEQRDRPDVAVVVSGRWEVMDRVLAGRWTHVGDPAFDAGLTADLEQAVAVLHADGTPVVLTTAPYYLRGERPDGGRWPEDDPARVDAYNRLVRAVAARHPGVVHLVDLGARLGPSGHYQRDLDGIEMRYDGVHLTPAADRWLAPWLLPQLAAAAGRPGT